jgi:hypothetical protein
MLPADLAAALLNVPFDAEVASQPEFHQSIGQRLTAAKAELEAATVAANQVLSSNPLMEIIAEHAARLVGRRGRPTVVVASSGDVMLEIHYLAAGDPLPPAVPSKPKKTKMPPISEIRREAVLLGIDPTPYGKNKTRLIAAVDAAKAVVSPPAAPKPSAPKQKRMKTAPAITPAVPVELVGRKVIPLDVDDDDDDLSSLFADDPPKAPAPKPPAPEPPAPKSKSKPKPLSKPRPTPASPKRGTPAVKAAAPKRMGRSLSAIAQNAENEVDIDAILAKPAPKIPRED